MAALPSVRPPFRCLWVLSNLRPLHAIGLGQINLGSGPRSALYEKTASVPLVVILFQVLEVGTSGISSLFKYFNKCRTCFIFHIDCIYFISKYTYALGPRLTPDRHH